MTPFHLQKSLCIICFVLGFCQSFLASNDSTFTLLLKGRALFYESVEKSDKIDEAINLFREIEKNEQYKGVAATYHGALIALKGKYAFQPIKKYRLVLKGLKMMDAGVLFEPDNIESRFIRGMTCFYLPFFFKRKDQAVEDFKNILQQLETSYTQYDSEMVMNVTLFLLENLELSDKEILIITEIQKKLQANEN